MVFKRTTIRKRPMRKRVQRKRTVVDNPNKLLVIRSKNHQIINDRVEVWLGGTVSYFASSSALTNAHRYFDLNLNGPLPFTNSGITQTVALSTVFPTQNTYSDAIATGTLIGYNQYQNTGGIAGGGLYTKAWLLKSHVTIQLQTQALGDSYYIMMIPYVQSDYNYGNDKGALLVSPFENAENPFASKIKCVNGYMDNTDSTLKCTLDMLKLTGKSKKEFLANDSYSITSEAGSISGVSAAAFMRVFVWSVDNSANAQPVSISVKVRSQWHFEGPVNAYTN